MTRRPPAPIWWVGTALAVGGAGLMLAGPQSSVPSAAHSRIDSAGLALCLVAGLAYASFTLISQRLVSRAPPATVTLWSFSIAAAIAVPCAALTSTPFTSGTRSWAVVIYLGLVSTGVAYLLFSNALRSISGATGVTLALAEPVAAFVLAIVAVGERPGLGAFAGLAMVLAGLFVVVWAETRTPRS